MYGLPNSLLDSMAQQSLALSVVDVYDLAASIGKEFETIIENYGPEAVTDLMPKVINTLEHLEILCAKNQKENGEVLELKYTIERLHSEKAAKAEERLRFEKEVEQIEDTWRKETRELVENVTKLQEDNRRMLRMLNEHEGNSTKLQRAEEETDDLLMHLKETVDQQRNEIRAMRKDQAQKTVDLEAMQAQMERLAKLNADYRRKSSLSQRQSRSLIQEKADLQMSLHDKEQQIAKIKERMARQDSFEANSPTSPDQPNAKKPATVDEEVSDAVLEKFEERLSREGKMVIDLSDPNRPRFTLNELRDVLQERNELKTKLIEVEEELKTYRPEDKGAADGSDDVFGEDDEENIDPTELPVQGPINKEPDEKLNPERYQQDESGIRKLFQRFIEKLNIEPLVCQGPNLPL